MPSPPRPRPPPDPLRAAAPVGARDLLRLRGPVVAGHPGRRARLAADHRRARGDRDRVRSPGRDVLRGAQLHQPAAPDGGHRHHRHRRGVRVAHRRDRPVGGLRQRRRRRRGRPAAAPRRSGLALVARPPHRPGHHHDDRVPACDRDHQGGRALLRGDPRRPADLERRRAVPDGRLLRRRHHPHPGRHGDRHRQRLPQPGDGVDDRHHGRRRLRRHPDPDREDPAGRSVSTPSRHRCWCSRWSGLAVAIFATVWYREPRSRRPHRDPDPRDLPGRLVVRRRPDALRTPRLRRRGATPRPPVGPASTSTACGSWCS